MGVLHHDTPRSRMPANCHCVQLEVPADLLE